MSQRRQDARKAAQQRRRQEQRDVRVRQQRQRSTVARPGGAASAPTAAPARAAPARPILRYALIGVGAALVVALGVWLWIQQNKPLPGTKFPSNGNAHVEPGQPHGAYFSNPPTSGWHYSAIPKPGVYTNPIPPEGLGHFMEHGGVWVLYTCEGGRSGCPDLAEQLEDITNKAIDRGKFVAVGPYPTQGITPPEHKINVIAWQYLLSLDEVDRGRINDFIDRHVCRYNPERGPYCAGGGGKTGPEKTPESGGFNPSGVTPGATAAATITPIATPTPAPAGPTPAPTPAGTATPAR